jgi:hypothetical protein
MEHLFSSIRPRTVCPQNIEEILSMYDHFTLDGATYEDRSEAEIEVVQPRVATVTEAASKIVDSLSTVGVESINIRSSPVFSPHGRNISEIPDLGDFEFNDEVVEEWIFPALGAERLTKNKLSSIGVVSPSGLVASDVVVHVVDAAREKLDGFEVVQFGIRTASYEQFFEWDDKQLSLVQARHPAVYERVNDVKYLLSGYEDSPDLVRHKWEYLNTSLVRQSKEGIIVRISGKEYRIPRDMTATFMVISGVACDCTGFSFQCPGVSDGLSDFVWRGSIWSYLKRRLDKNVPDNIRTVMSFVSHTVTLSEFLDSVIIPYGPRMELPAVRRIVYLPPTIGISRRHVFQQSSDIHPLYVRTAGIKTDMSLRDRINENSNNYQPAIQWIPNEIITSGILRKVVRCKFKSFYCRQYYYSDKQLRDFELVYFRCSWITGHRYFGRLLVRGYRKKSATDVLYHSQTLSNNSLIIDPEVDE